MPEQKRRKGDQTGTLIIIGGHEDKEKDMVILREVARRVGNQKLLVTTVASHQPEGYFESYQEAFARLGITDLTELYVAERSEAMQEEKIRAFDGVKAVFFTGGDQLRITSQIGDTPIYSRIHEIYEEGGLIIGTSAGASVMCETMMIEGKGGESHRIGDLRMAPGLKLIRNAIIDQHFAERGRMGRLLGAVAQNPRVLGIGIDEDTAIIMEGQEHFTVLGDGAVYVVDASGVTHSNIAEAGPEQILSIYDIRLHVLSQGDAFDLVHRRPIEAWRLGNWLPEPVSAKPPKGETEGTPSRSKKKDPSA